jgi:glyoxylase-like metal-dependent hydrolase (beta-lactamase superfamily II)
VSAQSTEKTPFMRWSIGAATVTRVLEMPPISADPAIFIQTNKQEVQQRRDWLYPDYSDEDGNIKLHFQAFIIEAGGKRIMVDPCIGNDKKRSYEALSMLDGPFLKRLEEAGYPRESIDCVLCTHLHADHCGWNTMLVDGRWVPTFPNAEYLFAKAEYEHLQVDDHGDAPAVLDDSVRPIIEAGLAKFVDPGHFIVEEVRLEPTPGHTPGHCSIVISSDGQEALITGDLLHHPVQVAIPHVGDNFCWNHEMARSTRRLVLERASSRKALLLGSHFSGPTGIYIKPDGDAWIIDSKLPAE